MKSQPRKRGAPQPPRLRPHRPAPTKRSGSSPRRPAPSPSPPAAGEAVTIPSCGFVTDRDEAAAAVERLLGYKFRDRQLLDEALTHQSFADGAGSYQRLEFVGDAALGLAFSNFLFLTNPTLGPGPLSTLRAANISTEKLARVAVRHNLYPLLRRNCPRLDLLVSHFIQSIQHETEDDLGGLFYGGCDLKAPKVLADVVEAIAAAVYVDCNFNLEELWKVMRGIFEPIITAQTIDEQPVTTLHELCQKHGKTAVFKTWQKSGMTVVNVFVGPELVGIGSSEQKMIAKLNASRDALAKLQGGSKAGILTIALGDGSGDEAGDLRECKQKLNELCSRKHWPKPIYKIEKEEGPAHERKFICSVQIESTDKTYVTIGDLKPRVKDAENAAAHKMLSEVLANV